MSECRSSSHNHNSKLPFVSYLSQLRELALDRNKLENGTILRMTLSKMLLGSRRVKSAGVNASMELQDKLLQPSEVVIVDDVNAYHLFGDHIFRAPQDDIIEGTQLNVFGFPCITYCN
jgi:hypothetical protein